MRANARTGSIAAGLIFSVAVLTAAGWYAYTPAPLILQGEVEATQIDVASKIPGRVSALHVREGEDVSRDQLLVTMDSPEIRARLAQATAAERAAVAGQRKAQNGARQEDILAVRHLWQKSVAACELADKTFRRVSKLHADGVLPGQKLDEAEAQWKAARETVGAARAAYDKALAGARDEDQDAASALAAQAAGAVSEVEAYLRETRLLAPIAGQVANLIVDPGELVSAGYPIVSLVDLNDIWVSLYLREDLLAQVEMGDTLTATFPALGNRKAVLRVTHISALGDFATWHATKTSGDFDMKTFEIRAVPLEPVEGLRPGMSALFTWQRSQ